MKKAFLKNRYKITWPIVFIAPFFVLFFAFNLYPILYALYMSFLNWNGFGEKTFVGFRNYIELFTRDKTFWKSLWYTVRIGVTAYPISIILGLLLAAIISNFKHMKNLFQTINFLPYITTPVAIGMVFVFIFEQHIGLFNKLITMFGGEAVNFIGSPKYAPWVVAFMIIWRSTGYYMAMYLAGITSVPEDVYEAARIDGANSRQIFLKITVPLLKPVTIFLTITSIIYALQLFDEPNLLFANTSSTSVGGPGQSCLTMVWNFYNQAFGANPRIGYASALSIILFFIITLVTVLGLKAIRGKEN